MSLLRSDLLEGRTVVLAGAVASDLDERLASLGARITRLQTLEEDPALEWARSTGPIDALVCGGRMLNGLDEAWTAVRAVANGALIPAGAGAIVLIGPRPDAGAHTEAVAAALENLARTLSVEWARYGISATAVVPGARTSAEDLATLIAFLCSVAGAYCSGCRFDLDAIT